MKTIMNYAHLKTLNIRKLKALAAGKGISKARYGKSWGRMNKDELCAALADYYRLIHAAPVAESWQTVRESTRIATVRADGKIWTTYLGFSTQQEAWKFYYWVLPQVSWALVRRGERTGCSWEIKIWGISRSLLDRLIQRDPPKIPARTPVIHVDPSDRESWGIAPRQAPTCIRGVAID